MFNLNFRDSSNTETNHLAWCRTNINLFNNANPFPNNPFCEWLFTQGESIYTYAPEQQLAAIEGLSSIIQSSITHCQEIFNQLFSNNFLFWELKFEGKPRVIVDINFVFSWPEAEEYQELYRLINLRCSEIHDQLIVDKLTELNLIESMNNITLEGNENYLAQKIRKYFKENGTFKTSLRKFGVYDDFKQFIGLCKNNFSYSKFIKKQNEWGAYQFIDSIDNTVCPYCNRSYTHSIFETNESSGRPELDHFLPKSVFQFFAVSMYNLIPVCHSCNHSKLDMHVIQIVNGQFEYSHLHPNIAEDNVHDTVIFKTVNGGDIVEFLLHNDYSLADKITLTDDCISDHKLINSLAAYNLASIPHGQQHIRGYYSYHYKDVERTLNMVKRYPAIAIESIASLIGENKEQLQKSFIQIMLNDAPYDEPLGKLKNDMLSDVVDSWSD